MLSNIFEKVDDQMVEVWREYIETEKNKHYWVAQLDTEIIGIAISHEWGVLPKPNKSIRKYWQVSNFFVKPEHRNVEIGSKFLNYILNEAKKEKIEKVMTFAGGSFGDFFIQNGFQKENTLLLKKLSITESSS